MTVSLDDIERAAKVIQGQVQETPCLASRTLSEISGAEVYLKFENHQFTASFKERGALNKLTSLDGAQRAKGVIAYSAGNHAQGVAYHAHRLGIHAVIVMPRYTPFVKVEHTERHGAEVVLEGDNFDAAKDYALRAVKERGLTLVHPYDDEKIIAGQGTMGLEILEALPEVETVLVPVGGGGMISGIATAIKLSRPSVKVIGVEPELAADAQASFRSAKLVDFPAEQVTQTIADGLRTQSIGPINFEHIRRYVDDIVTVSEDEIRGAMRRLAANPKTVAEPSGAVAVAGFLFHAEQLPRATVHVAVISGGNIEPGMLRELRQQ